MARTLVGNPLGALYAKANCNALTGGTLASGYAVVCVGKYPMRRHAKTPTVSVVEHLRDNIITPSCGFRAAFMVVR